MGSYDGAEVCELAGLFLLNILTGRFGKDSVGLYRGWLVNLLRNGGRQADKARKDLYRIFNELELKVTAELNNHLVNSLHVTFNLKKENYHPCRKPNNNPLYIDSRSNHPPKIIKQLSKSINNRLSTLSSDEKSFKTSAPLYEQALLHSNYNTKLVYFAEKPESSTQKTKQKRRKNVIWINPNYNKNVRTNVARKLLALIDKHFPKTVTLNYFTDKHQLFHSMIKLLSLALQNNKSPRIIKDFDLLGACCVQHKKRVLCVTCKKMHSTGRLAKLVGINKKINLDYDFDFSSYSY